MGQKAVKSHADVKKHQTVVGKLHSAESITQFSQALVDTKNKYKMHLLNKRKEAEETEKSMKMESSTKRISCNKEKERRT